MTVKIVSWNLNHRAREKPMPPALLEAIALLAADVLVLNEYVDGPSRDAFNAGLETIGLKHVALSSAIPGENQVMIASRFPHRTGMLQPPCYTAAATSNFLHRRFDSMEVVALRAPAYSVKKDRVGYWNELSEIISSAQGRSIVFIGDLNANPQQPKKTGGGALSRLLQQGWQIPEPEGTWSFISTDGSKRSKVDHAIVSPVMSVFSARYRYHDQDFVYAGESSQNPLSDHAPLEVIVSGSRGRSYSRPLPAL